MKRKMFMTVVIALIVCLSCGMLLVACNKKGNNDDNDDNQHTSTLVSADLNEVLGNVIDGIDAANKAENGEIAFSVEISETDTNAENFGTLFGLGYEKLNGEYYIYAKAGGGEYVKINATSVGALFDNVFAVLDATLDGFTMTDGYPTISVGGGSLKIEPNIVKAFMSAFGSMLFEKAEQSVDGAYVLYLDLESIIKNIPSLVTELVSYFNKDIEIPDGANLAQTIEAIAGLESGTVDGYVAKYAGIIFKDAEITTLDELLTYIEEQVDTIEVKVGFMFDGRVAEDATNPFVDVAGITDAVRETNAVNLLNFSATGTVTGYLEGDDGLRTENKLYKVDVDSDINPFALVALIENVETDESGKAVLKMDKDEINAMLDKLGYISVTVDEIDAEGKIVKNILTFYYDSADENNIVIAALQSHSFSGLASLGMGGVYNIDALMDVIGMLTSGAATTTSDGESAALNLDIPALIQTLLGYIDIDNVASDGVVIEIGNLVDKVMEIVSGSAPEGAAKSAIDAIIGSDVLAVRFDSFSYGKCEKRAYSDLVANLRTNTNSFESDMNPHTDNDVYVGEITSIPGLENGAKIGLGSSITSVLTESQTGQGLPLYIMNGTDLITGKDIVTSGLIMAVEGFDPDTLGEQNVTVYVGVLSDFYFAVGAINNFIEPDITLNPLWPLFGVLRYDVTVEVVDPMLDYTEAYGVAQVVFGQFGGDVTSLSVSAGQTWYNGFYGDDMWSMSLALKTSADDNTEFIELTKEDISNSNAIRITDSEGNNVTEQVIAAGGVIDKAGTYKLLLVKNGYGATIDLVVS